MAPTSRVPVLRGGVDRLMRATALCAAAALLFSGCAGAREYCQNGFKVGPNYERPSVAVASDWVDATDPQVTASAPPRDDWWKVFGDPALDRLIALASEQNPDLRVAAWRIQEARAQRGIASGELFPQQQSVSAAYSRRAVSATVANQVHNRRFFDEWSFGPAMAWELDFWGLYRRAIEAADAEFDASIDNYNGVMVILLSDVAANYIDIRTAEQRLEYLRKNVKIQRVSLEIGRQRFHEGATSELDVSQFTANVEFTESQIPPIEAARRQAANRLCVLLGMPPHDVDDLLRGSQSIPSAPAEVAIGIPADLLRRRPDVRKAEREMAAQSAKIGIATAELYPHLSIIGNIGVDSSSVAQLFDPRSLTGNVGPAIHWDILNYGRLKNGIRVQDARFQQLAWQYQTRILTANEEAETALVAFLKSQRQLQSLNRSTEAAQRSVDTVMTRYREGLVDFNTMFTLELFLTERQDEMAQVTGTVPRNLISLYKALGGGWQACPDPSGTPPTSTTEEIPKPEKNDQEAIAPTVSQDAEKDVHEPAGKDMDP